MEYYNPATMSDKKRFNMDNYSGTRAERVRKIMDELVQARMTGDVEIFTTYQKLRFTMTNGRLAKSSSICSYADIIAHFE